MKGRGHVEGNNIVISFSIFKMKRCERAERRATFGEDGVEWR